MRPLYDMMAITLENLPSMPAVVRTTIGSFSLKKKTIGSLLILCHIISLTSVSTDAPMVFPEALLHQILISMVHPDADTRAGAHHIFSAVIFRGPSHQREEQRHSALAYHICHSFYIRRTGLMSAKHTQTCVFHQESLGFVEPAVLVALQFLDDLQHD